MNLKRELAMNLIKTLISLELITNTLNFAKIRYYYYELCEEQQYYLDMYVEEEARDRQQWLRSIEEENRYE